MTTTTAQPEEQTRVTTIDAFTDHTIATAVGIEVPNPRPLRLFPPVHKKPSFAEEKEELLNWCLEKLHIVDQDAFIKEFNKTYILRDK